MAKTLNNHTAGTQTGSHHGMTKPHFPSLYQVNTRVWLNGLSTKYQYVVNLDNIPDSELDKLAAGGFDWIWLLSVWQTGKTGQQISRTNPDWRKDFLGTLPDLHEEDIIGSGFAITRYSVSDRLGGDDALARLRKRLADRGMKLMLDFVPNHTAIDHEWIGPHPEYFVHGNEEDIKTHPDNFIRVSLPSGDTVLAHGRDPFFPGWPDTLQLNYGNPDLQEAMKGEIARIAGQCDGVRCDMAMLVLPDIFQKTWGISCRDFWPDAINTARAINSEFCFMAEVYWDLEWTMIRNGFDFAYDKRLYDRLKEGSSRSVREHFYAGLEYQGHMARFLENHDEPRAAAEFPEGMHEAAAVITYLSPGLRFIHQGQMKGMKKKISPHLLRGPDEPVNHKLQGFYINLVKLIRRRIFRDGQWQLLDCAPAWEGNPSSDNFIAFAWSDPRGEKLVVVVNYASYRGQCYVRLPFTDLGNKLWTLHDLLGDYAYVRDGSDLELKGLYLDENSWKAYAFLMSENK